MELRLLAYFVAVAEERHFGRAAARLRMTQPPLSRAIRRLEEQFGLALVVRTPRGVSLTPAGVALYDGARALLEQAQRLREKVIAASGPRTLVIGTLADSAAHVGSTLVGEFRRRHGDVEVSVIESDLSDPTAGLRAGVVDVALTRTPFQDVGMSTIRLGSDRLGMVVRDDDPLAQRREVRVEDLPDRRWIRLPPDTDSTWCAYWTVAPKQDHEPGPVMRTIQECLQAVLWSGASALAPLNQNLPAGLIAVPAVDRPPSHLVVAFKEGQHNPLVRAFLDVASDVFAQ